MSTSHALSVSLALALASVGCKDRNDQRPASGVSRSEVEGKPRKAGTTAADSERDDDRPRKTKLEQKREELLLLDAALSKLEKEIEAAEKAGDFEALAGLRDKEKAVRMSIENARKDIQLMEFMQKRAKEQKQQGDAGSDQ